MLSKRQKHILTILDMHQNDFVTGKSLSTQMVCSVKTLQNDIKTLKSVLKQHSADILSVPHKGYVLIVDTEENYNYFKQQELYEDTSYDFNDQSTRIAYILNRLFVHDSYMKAEDLADEMFVSRSSLSMDMKIVKKILEKYSLSIISKPNYGMKVYGKEKDMRECITKEQIGLKAESFFVDKERLSTITNVIVDTLMNAKYRISDVVLQNLVLHVSVSIQRMKHGIYIQETNDLSMPQELMIAQKILTQLADIFLFELKESEVSFLATHLLSKRSYDEDDVINQEVDIFVNGILDEIKEKINIDLSGDIELKISLALHLAPLLVRLENHMQLKNTYVHDIQTNYPLAYDMAIIAASHIFSQVHDVLDEDEVGYLAVHFSLALSKQENKMNPRKVLIICSARRGDYLMMQHMFMKEFSEMISQLDIINAIDIPYRHLEEYDCIFTTFLNHPLIPRRALRINFFLDAKDKQRIKKILLGQTENSEVLKYFQKEYFMGILDAKDREDVIRQMCMYAHSLSEFDEDLYESCLRREVLGSTSYGHYVALPHPDSLISQKTIVITAILKKPIQWSSQVVQLVFLICVEKGNQKDLRVLFEYISKLMMNDDNVQNVIMEKSHTALLRVLEKLLKGE